MKKFHFLFLATTVFCGLFLAVINTSGAIDNPIGTDDFEEFLDRIVGFVSNILFSVSLLMFGVGAFYFATAAGDPKRVETGKKILFYTAIGFLVAVLARALVFMLRYIIGIEP